MKCKHRTLLASLLWFTVLSGGLNSAPAAEPTSADANLYGNWTHGPSSDPGFFPIAVWLQNPARAAEYRKAGINTYVGLWRGPTAEQMEALSQAGMKLICHQSEASLRHRDSPTIIAWMHGDEPDNAQSLGANKGYGPPIAPEKIVAGYQKMRAADPSRPVLLNLGQGVAWDNWVGRGVRRNHPEDYSAYLKGCDIASFDIYPVVHDHKEVTGKLDFVARGVERLIQWSNGEKIVWNCLECTHISDPERKATPRQVRSEAWMSLIHGSRGLIYFVHQFKPTFREAALLDDPEMLKAVTVLNQQITQLAPLLNSPTITNLATIKSGNPDVPIALMAKRDSGSVCLFAVGMKEGQTTATFTVNNLKGEQSVEVLGESRTLAAHDGVFHDAFEPWDAHVYRLKNGKP